MTFSCIFSQNCRADNVLLDICQDKAELPKITPHVCRHTYCSHMASSGVNPKHLQYLMGHSEISVTLDVYTHVDWDNLRGDINLLNIDEERNGYSVMA